MIGYDKYRINFETELDLPFYEMTGLLAHDVGRDHVTCTLRGTGGLPGWQQFINGLPRLEFTAANGEFIDAPQAASTGLDFTVGDFSLAVWIRQDDISVRRDLIVRGLANTDGWYLFVDNTGRLAFATCQAAATQATYSTAGAVVVATWALFGIDRSGDAVRTWKNGEDITDAPDVHVDPLTANRELHIGIYDDEASNPYDGGMWRPRAWSRRLAGWEWRRLYLQERIWFP